MFDKIKAGSVVLAPYTVHGGRRDKAPTVFYVMSEVQQVNRKEIVVNDKAYDRNGRAKGFSTLPLRSYSPELDQTVEYKEYLQTIKLRNIVRDNLLDCDTVESLTADQLNRILNIIDSKSRYYRNQ